MSSMLITALHTEERAIAAELRASKLFQRLDGVRRLLALYDAQPSVATGLETSAPAEPERPAASVIPMAAASPPAIPMPGPVAAMAEAAVAEAARPQPAFVTADAHAEPASVVSNVRAALLGIGKG